MTLSTVAEPTGDQLVPDLAEFVTHWTRAINRAAHVPMTTAESHRLLRGLADRLGLAMLAEPHFAWSGYWVAADLVTAGFDAPEVLSSSIEVIETRLPAALGLTGPAARAQLTALVQAFAGGFARALRDRTLDAQEEIRVAALTARAQAERELRTSEARHRHAALHDALTGLPNHARFLEQLRRLCTAPVPFPRFGLCHLGLDGLDAVKTSLGPDVGDQLVHMVAERLHQFAADTGHLTARWGDDQFVVLVPGTTTVTDAVQVAEQLLARINRPYQLHGLDLPVSATAGVVERAAAGADPTEVMRAADLARHWARASRPGGWMVFDPRRNAQEVERYRLSAALPAALQRGEFVLYYQPLVDLQHGALRGLEGLARWRHPTRGLLGPERFIGLAEDTGLIVRLGQQLLEQACRQAAGWGELTDHPPYVSVNLAVPQLRQPGLVGEVAAILARTRLPAHRLQLEITETAGIEDGLIDTLRALAALGVRLVIDDFGTGYSNLSYLLTLPLHGVKLAHALLGHRADARGDAFLAHLIGLAHTLDLTVTGEGVETAVAAERLRAAGCDLGQGWYLGRPVPADQTPDLIATHHPWSLT